MNKFKKILYSFMLCLLSVTLLFPNVAFAASPDAPDNLDATAESDSEISLTWDEVDDAAEYYIYRSEESSDTDDFEKIDTTDDTEYTDSDLDPDTKYYYMVKAHNNDGTSDYSDYTCSTTDDENNSDLDAPDNLEATVESDSEISLTWDEVDDAAEYYIYRSEESSDTDDFEKIDTTDETEYTDSDLDVDTKYYYMVKAHNNDGTSDYSDYTYATTDADSSDLDAPDNLEVTVESDSEISLTWDEVDDAAEYYIYRSEESSDTDDFEKIDTTDETEYTDSDLKADTKYYYMVKAHNNDGTSDYSDYTYATTDADSSDLDAPDNLEVTVESDSEISLTWDEVDDAAEYYIYRSEESSDTDDFEKIDTTDETEYTDSDLKADTKYYYMVKAHNDDGTSDYSDKAYATTSSGSSSSSTANRLAGLDRYATSAEIAKSGWSASDYAIIASGKDYPDALCGAPLAAKYNAPILLTSQSSLDLTTKNQLTRLGVTKVFLIGGTGVISSSVERSIINMGITVTRLAGSDRYETSLKVAQALGGSTQAIIATGEDFPDALSIAPIAGIKGIPILLTPKNYLPANVKTYLNNNISSTYVIGGRGVISDNVYRLLPSPQRYSGQNRYETNLAVINAFSSVLNFNCSYLATGESFPDALTGSALASLKKAPIILVSNTVSLSTVNLIKNKNVENVIALGGTGAVPVSVLQSLISNISSSLDAPDNLDATAESDSEISLQWDEVDDADEYYIYRSEESSDTDDFEKIDTTDDTEYTDSDLDADTKYYYMVKAHNDDGTSDYSNQAYDTTDEDSSDLDAPDNLDATAESDSEIFLQWDEVDDADEYYIYRSEESSDTDDFEKIDTTDDTEYTDSDLDADTKYYYMVKAHNDDGTSDYSNQAYDTTDAN